MPESPRPEELGQLVDLIASQQVHADRNIGYLGTDKAGIAAELTGLAPPWVTTARVLRAEGRIVGVVLVLTLTRQLLEWSPAGRVCLTVQDHRAPARALYERLGFRHDAALVGYRSWQD